MAKKNKKGGDDPVYKKIKTALDKGGVAPRINGVVGTAPKKEKGPLARSLNLQYKEPTQPVAIKQPDIVQIPTRKSRITDPLDILDISLIKNGQEKKVPPIQGYKIPESIYTDGVLKQEFKGVPNVEVWSKRRKDDNTLRPVALVNQAGESIDYNKYKDSNLPEKLSVSRKR